MRRAFLPGAHRAADAAPLASGRRERTEEGVAYLLVVIAITLVMAVLATTLFNVALDNVSTATRMVDQEQALQAAEAGVDAAFQAIETSSRYAGSAAATLLAKLPCKTLTGALGSMPSSQRTSTYTVTYAYYATLGTTTSALACTPTATSNAALEQATGVIVTSVGKDSGQTAKVQSEANIATPDKTGVFNASVFVNGSLSLQGGADFVGGNNNIYLNGTLACRGGASVDGSVTVFGKVSTNGGCAIAGELEATTTITLGGTALVGGTVISTCPPATCTTGISVSGHPTVSGSMYAKSAISVPTGWKATYLAAHTVTVGGVTTSVHYTINQDETSLVTPPKQTFPSIVWTAPGWTKKGYTVVTAGSTCTNARSTVAAISSASAPVALHTSCSLTLSSLNLAQSLAIVTTGTVKIKSNAVVSASSRQTLFVIVPTAHQTCSGVTVTIKGTIGATVSTFVYTPCDVKISGTGNIKSGKVYSGQLTVDGSITVGSATFTVPGSAGGAATHPILGVVYERQLS